MKRWSKVNEISAESGSFPGLMQVVRKPERPESSLANTVGWLSLLKRSGNALSNLLHRAANVCLCRSWGQAPPALCSSFLAQGNRAEIWCCLTCVWTALPTEWGNSVAEDSLPNQPDTSSTRCWPLPRSRIKESLWIRPVPKACRHLCAFRAQVFCFSSQGGQRVSAGLSPLVRCLNFPEEGKGSFRVNLNLFGGTRKGEQELCFTGF